MSQNELVLQYIKDFGSTTQLEATADLGIMRLPSRIHDLRRNGYPIESKNETRQNRYGKNTTYSRYYLKERTEVC